MSITASRPGRKIDYTIIDYGIMAVYQFYHGDGASYVMIVPKRIKMEGKKSAEYAKFTQEEEK